MLAEQADEIARLTALRDKIIDGVTRLAREHAGDHARRAAACRTSRRCSSTASRARPCCCSSTTRASRSRPARRARRARSSRATCCSRSAARRRSLTASLRISLGRFTTEADVDYFLEVFPPIVERLRAMSPVYEKMFGSEVAARHRRPRTRRRTPVLYSDKVMDHFNNPRNVGVIEDADGVGEVGNPVCGDIMKITIKVDDTEHIDDVKFQTLGCGAAIATSSIVTEMAKGMTLEEAAAISKQQVADELGGLPPAKMHCSVLATDGLKVAVDDYLKKHGREPIAGEIKSRRPELRSARRRGRPRRRRTTTTTRDRCRVQRLLPAPVAPSWSVAVARVFVAMSGGVDSSVAAALLLEQGHDVTGVTMQLWPSSDDEGGCCSVSAVRDARRVCDLLGIPHYTLNFRDVFEREVVGPFADEYAAGRTPNPCIVCNDRLKFSDLLAKVSAQGADFLATGHYARIVARCDGRAVARARRRSGQGPVATSSTGSRAPRWSTCCFPSASCTSPRCARSPSASACTSPRSPTARRCASPRRGSTRGRAASARPEALVAGRHRRRSREPSLGRHDGIANYTVGQRKGLGDRRRRTALRRWRSTPPRNRVVVGPTERAARHARRRRRRGLARWRRASASRRWCATAWRRAPPRAHRRMVTARGRVRRAARGRRSRVRLSYATEDDIVPRRRGDHVRELIDCHIHTERCGHATGTVDDYVARRGASAAWYGIAITEHLALPEDLDPHRHLSMPACDLEDYLVEVDLRAQRLPEIADRHRARGRLPAGPRGRDARGYSPRRDTRSDGARVRARQRALHRRVGVRRPAPRRASGTSATSTPRGRDYFALWCDAARAGCSTCMAHPDLVKKFGHCPSLRPARALRRGRAGRRRGRRARSRSPLRACASRSASSTPGTSCSSAFRAAGVAATVGSDAHEPDEVGYRDRRRLRRRCWRPGYAEVRSRTVAVVGGRCRYEPSHASPTSSAPSRQRFPPSGPRTGTASGCSPVTPSARSPASSSRSIRRARPSSAPSQRGANVLRHAPSRVPQDARTGSRPGRGACGRGLRGAGRAVSRSSTRTPTSIARPPPGAAARCARPRRRIKPIERATHADDARHGLRPRRRTPSGSLEAMSGAGAGRVGEYEGCSFTSRRGTGTFTPGPRPPPFAGDPGEPSSAAEVRLEMVAPRSRARGVVGAARGAHPYEEPLIVAADVEIARSSGRMGMLSRAPAGLTLGALATRAAGRSTSPRVSGAIPRRRSRASPRPPARPARSIGDVMASRRAGACGG